MRARLVALALAVTLSVPLAARPATGATPRLFFNDRYCSFFAEYFTVTLLIEFLSELTEAFSSLPGDETTISTEPELQPGEFRSTMQAMLSPKLVRLTTQLSGRGPRAMRAEFRRERKVFAQGIAILRDAGLTAEQVNVIANVKVDPSTFDIEDLSDKIDLSDEETQAIGREFLPYSQQLQLDDLDSDLTQQFQAAGTACGVIPSQDIDCEDVFSQSDAAEIVGSDVTLDEADGCRYVGTSDGTESEAEVAVVIYDTDRAFKILTKPVEPEPVDDVGDRAVSFEGFSASGKERTCGRTLVAIADERTIVTALCLADDEPVEDAQLVDITQGVIDRLATR